MTGDQVYLFWVIADTSSLVFDRRHTLVPGDYIAPSLK